MNWKCEMMMDDDEMNFFLHSLYNGILRARGWHGINFRYLLFALLTLLAPCMLYFETVGSWKLCAKTFCAY